MTSDQLVDFEAALSEFQTFSDSARALGLTETEIVALFLLYAAKRIDRAAVSP